MSSPVKAGLDSLVWLIVIAIVIASQLVKAASRMGRPTDDAGDGNWGLPDPDAGKSGSLDERIAEYLVRKRGAAPVRRAPSTARRRTPPRLRVAPVPPTGRRPSPLRRPRPMPRVTPPPLRRPPRAPAAPLPALPARPVYAAAAPATPPPRRAAPRPAAPSSTADLRNAVHADLGHTASLRRAFLLSEILGPPRALRALRLAR